MKTRSDDRALQLPEGWVRPVPDIGRSLFSDPVDEALAELRVTRDEARHWHQAGRLSFNIDETCKLDLSQQVEIGFIRSLASSGLGDVLLDHLLQGMRRPLAYHSDQIAYSFVHGWVTHVEQDPYEVVEANVMDWLEELASSGETEKLRSLAAKIVECLESIADDQP